MATEREAAFPIEDFRGINRNVDREKILPQHVWSAQNLWEHSLGVLETRWGSEEFAEAEDGLPTAIVKTMANTKLYKASGESVRLAAIQCTPATENISALPTGFALSFVNDDDGFWNEEFTYGATTWSGTPAYVLIRFVGYGFDKHYIVATSSVTGYSASTRQKLRITQTGAPPENCTGVEVYAVVKCGSSATIAAITPTSTYNHVTMWCGFQSLVGTTSGTYDFLHVPLGQNSTATVEVGELKRTFDVTASETGGTLKNGKTYYIAVAPHHIKLATNPASRCAWRIPDVDRLGTDIVAVTIPGSSGNTGSISVSNISPATISFMVAIGESPELMMPYAVFNDSGNAFGGGSGWSVDAVPDGSPALMDIRPYAATDTYYQFRVSDFSVYDMFCKIDDDGNVKPVFAARLDKDLNEWDSWTDYYLGSYSLTRYTLNNGTDQTCRLGVGSKYNFQQVDDLLFFVNSFNPSDRAESETGFPIVHKTDSNYSQTDGHIVGSVIEAYQSTKITLPVFRYISYFQGSVMLGGGPTTVDRENGLGQSAARRVYISRADDPYDFTIPGAASTTHQFIQAGQDAEELNGLGICSNTSSDSGPLTQFLITKKSSFLLLNNIPEVDNGALVGSPDLRVASARAGGAGHNVIVNTPIGTIVAAVDNVYLIRDNGEPTPIGQEVAEILKGADLSNAFACYHDKHYKISFYHEDYADPSDLINGLTHNNVELWLNINKQIEGKGQPDWVGPMIGRSIQHCFVEDKSGDGLTYNIARDRVCCDGSTPRIFKTDVMPDETDDVIYDFEDEVEVFFEGKDLEVSQQDNNWNKLVKRTYWKVRTNRLANDPINVTESTYMDGALAEEKTVQMYANQDADFNEQPLKLNNVFPVGRPRGRTIRKSLRTTDRIGIAGYQVNYEIERRRI